MSSKSVLSSFQQLKTHPTLWTPEDANVTLNITLDACIVPVESGGARVDFASLVVLDDFFGETERSSLLDFLTEPGEYSTMVQPCCLMLPQPCSLCSVQLLLAHLEVCIHASHQDSLHINPDRPFLSATKPDIKWKNLSCFFTCCSLGHMV